MSLVGQNLCMRKTGPADEPVVLRIGTVELKGRCIGAPMSGVTDAGMRRAAIRFGAPLMVSEMVAADSLIGLDSESRLRAEHVPGAPHSVQIAGRDPLLMGEATRMAQHCGADIIDINMGCPAKKVVGGLAGSALMRDLPLAVSLIRAVVAASQVPVTLKMRLGWDDGCLNAPDLARMAEAEGVAMIAVHGRTRQQFYKGQANWRAIHAVRDAIKIPLAANGDVQNLQDAQGIQRDSGADAVMVGRAATGQPWLIGQLARGLESTAEPAGPEAAERQDAALSHYQSLLAGFGIARGLRHARKHLAAYARCARADGFVVTDDTAARLVSSEDHECVSRLLASLWDELGGAKRGIIQDGFAGVMAA